MKAIDRLFLYFEHKGLKPTPVGMELGLTNGYLGKMRDRHGSIGSDILETIFSNFPDLSPEWLITGSGSMIKGDTIMQSSVTPNDNMMQLVQTITSQAETIGSLKKEVEVLQDRIQKLQQDVSNSKDEDAPNVKNAIAI